MKRRDMLKAGAALLGSAALARRPGRNALAAGQEKARPDIVFIACEDLQTSLSCYGNPVVKTPNLDALAARGVRFHNAHCQFPVCNPTRSSLLTGRYPATTGVFGNATDWREPLKSFVTIPRHFEAHGYETMRCGKIFHGGNEGRVFDDKAWWGKVIAPGEGLGAVTHKRREPRVLYDNLSPAEREKQYDTRAWVWGPSGQDDIEMIDGRVAEQAVRVLSQRQSKRLFLALGFHSTHLPLIAPDKYFDLYSLADIRLPQNPSNDFDDLPRPYGLANHKQFTDEKRREAIRAYYACCAFVDAGIGRIVKALEDSGRMRNTVVVFWGDHGFHLGEHFLWQKMTLFEESTRVPFIMWAPGVTRAGSVCNRPVELIDLYPTLCELAGLPLPDGLEGLSMVPLLRDPSRAWRKGAFTTMGPNRGSTIRTERWRYTEWGAPDRAELYDHESDPHEFTNVAKEQKHAETVAELTKLLNGGWRARLPEARG